MKRIPHSERYKPIDTPESDLICPISNEPTLEVGDLVQWDVADDSDAWYWNKLNIRGVGIVMETFLMGIEGAGRDRNESFYVPSAKIMWSNSMDNCDSETNTSHSCVKRISRIKQ